MYNNSSGMLQVSNTTFSYIVQISFDSDGYRNIFANGYNAYTLPMAGVRLTFIKSNYSYILNGNSTNLCMLAHYYIEILLWFRQFEKGMAHFSCEYFMSTPVFYIITTYRMSVSHKVYFTKDEWKGWGVRMFLCFILFFFIIKESDRQQNVIQIYIQYCTFI